MSEKTGGPAFPVKGMQTLGGGQQVDFVFNSGMTLRDYFAAKAMQGFLSRTETGLQVAEAAYIIADAMLREREK